MMKEHREKSVFTQSMIGVHFETMRREMETMATTYYGYNDDDDSTLQRWIEERIRDSSKDDDSGHRFEISVNDAAMFIWVVTLLLCGCICCCCALCCARSTWLVGIEAVILGFMILNWNFSHFPFMLLVFTLFSLYLFIQTIQRMREAQEREQVGFQQ
jgi:hypothetical protein